MDGSRKARKYVREMNRILRDDGAFVCISSGDPRDRLAVLELWDVDNLEESLPWDVQVDAVPKPTVKARDAPDLCDPEQLYFIYICIKVGLAYSVFHFMLTLMWILRRRTHAK
jgi:hypothetical protein